MAGSCEYDCPSTPDQASSDNCYSFTYRNLSLAHGQRMVWVFGQPIWEQIFRNARQRRNAFQITVKTMLYGWGRAIFYEPESTLGPITSSNTL